MLVASATAIRAGTGASWSPKWSGMSSVRVAEVLGLAGLFGPGTGRPLGSLATAGPRTGNGGDGPSASLLLAPGRRLVPGDCSPTPGPVLAASALLGMNLMGLSTLVRSASGPKKTAAASTSPMITTNQVASADFFVCSNENDGARLSSNVASSWAMVFAGPGSSGGLRQLHQLDDHHPADAERDRVGVAGRSNWTPLWNRRDPVAATLGTEKCLTAPTSDGGS